MPRFQVLDRFLRSCLHLPVISENMSPGIHGFWPTKSYRFGVDFCPKSQWRSKKVDLWLLFHSSKPFKSRIICSKHDSTGGFGTILGICMYLQQCQEQRAKSICWLCWILGYFGFLEDTLRNNETNRSRERKTVDLANVSSLCPIYPLLVARRAFED